MFLPLTDSYAGASPATLHMVYWVLGKEIDGPFALLWLSRQVPRPFALLWLSNPRSYKNEIQFNIRW